LPSASAAIGYALRDRKDALVTLEANAAAAVARAASPISTQAIEERINMLRRKDAELEREAKDVREKLDRVKVKDAAVKV
jgi:predicted nucleic acid-binding protein